MGEYSNYIFLINLAISYSNSPKMSLSPSKQFKIYKYKLIHEAFTRIDKHLNENPEAFTAPLELLRQFFLSRLIVEDPHNGLHDSQQFLGNGSIVTCFAPHTTNLDPFIASIFVRDFLYDRAPLNRILRAKFVFDRFKNLRKGNIELVSEEDVFNWIASARFDPKIAEKYGLEEEANSKMGTLMKGSEAFGKLIGCKNLPVFQPHYLKILSEELKKEAKLVNFSSIREAATFLNTAHGHTLAEMCEGTRNKKTQGFLKAGAGLDIFMRKSRKKNPSQAVPIRALPVLIRGAHLMQDPNNPGIQNLNPFVPITMVVGPLLSREDLQEIANHWRFRQTPEQRNGPFTLDDAMMLAIANLDPMMRDPNYDPRGVYSEENTSFTIPSVY